MGAMPVAEQEVGAPPLAGAELRFYATYVAGGLVALTLLGAAADCVQSWRSRRRRRDRALVLDRPAAHRLRDMLVLKADEDTADREETLWCRVFGATDPGGGGLCDVEEWTLAMRHLVPVEDISTQELETIFDAVDIDGHGLLTPHSLGDFVWAMTHIDQGGDGGHGATLVLLAAATIPPVLYGAMEMFSWHEIVWLCCAVFIALMTLGGIDHGSNQFTGYVRKWLRAEGASLRALVTGEERHRSSSADDFRYSPPTQRSSRARIIPPPRQGNADARNRHAVKFGGSTSLSQGLHRSPNAAAIHDEGKRQLLEGLREMAYSETRGVQDLDTLYRKLDRDRDGKIGYEDFNRAARRLIDAELSAPMLRELFEEVARAGHYTARRTQEEPEQDKEISKKALASFVWPRRAKTPPLKNRSTSTSTSTIRRSDRAQDGGGSNLEQHKSCPQKSSQAAPAHELCEEGRPNWAAAARWLAQAYTHRKAGRLDKATASLHAGLAMAAEHQGCLELLAEVQAELAAESVPAASSPPRSPPRDAREAGREYWKRQREQQQQQQQQPSTKERTVLRTPSAVRTAESETHQAVGARGDQLKASDQSRQRRLRSVEKKQTWRPPLTSPPHAGWRSTSPLQQQRRQQEQQKQRRRPAPASVSEARTGRLHRRRASPSPPPDDPRAAGWAYHTSRESASPPSPSVRRKTASGDEVERPRNRSVEWDKRTATEETSRVFQTQEVAHRQKVQPTPEKYASAQGAQLHLKPASEATRARTVGGAKASNPATKHVQQRMTARGQRRRRQLEEEQAAIQAHTADASSSSRPRTPAQHRFVFRLACTDYMCLFHK